MSGVRLLIDYLTAFAGVLASGWLISRLPAGNVYARLALSAAVEILFFFVPAYIRTKGRRPQKPDSGRKWGRRLAVSAACAAGLVILLSSVEGLLSLVPGYSPTMSSQASERGLTYILFSILCLAVLPAICEEIFFRGYVSLSLRTRNRLTAALVSALLFSAAHAEPLAMPSRFMFALVMECLAAVFGDISACVITHAAYNTISILLSLL